MTQQKHELAEALAQGFRYFPQNPQHPFAEPPLRPGMTVRLRNKGDMKKHPLVRLESEEDVTALKESYATETGKEPSSIQG